MNSESARSQEHIAQLERKLAALTKINRVLMDRVERTVDNTGSAYSLFERNITLHKNVETRTREKELLESTIAQMRIAEQQLRIAAIAFETREAILVTDPGTVILSVNHAFTRLTGYTEQEVIGQKTHLVGSDRHERAFYSAILESVAQTGGWAGEAWVRRKNGEDVQTNTLITAVKDENGNVSNTVVALTDITASKAAAAEIESLAFYDPLTSLPNRRLFMDRVKHAFAASSRSACHGALMFIDLDHFKNLNDTLGHDIGDLLLIQVAERLESCVREGDTVARLGGDEFVVMLENLSKQDVEAAAQVEISAHKILTTLNRPYQLGIHHYCNTPSIGISLFNDHHEGIEELMKQADIAMYEAKTSGRNAVRFFDPQMQEIIASRISLENDLSVALAQGQLQLYYQIQLDGERPTGAEALIRWQHPQHGLMLPAEFIPMAEETGLILPIGRWVIETACAQLKAWQQNALTAELVLAVNVSARQFKQTDFAAQVKAAITNASINPRLLKLELTESLLLDNIENTIATMHSLKKIGVQFSLDDFGTGYSSLQYLKRLPFDQIKIDQSFVQDLAFDSSDKAIVRTINAIAHSLKLDVIAEGVETKEQQQFLSNSGCASYQGYLFGRPMPIASFELLLQTA